MQTVIRTVKNRANPYVAINTTVFTDRRLSWKAKGMMGYLLSRPDDWQVLVKDLVGRSRDGREAVYSALRELCANGYVVRRTVRDERNRILRHEYLVFETPVRPDDGPDDTREPSPEPLTGFPYLEKPYVEHPPLDAENPILDSVIPTMSSPKSLAPQASSPLTGFPYVETAQVENPTVAGALPNNELKQHKPLPPHEVTGVEIRGSGGEEEGMTPAAPAVVVSDPSPPNPGEHTAISDVRDGRGGDLAVVVSGWIATYRELAGLDDLRPTWLRAQVYKHGLPYVREKVELLFDALRAGKVHQPVRWLAAALAEDYPTPARVADRSSDPCGHCGGRGYVLFEEDDRSQIGAAECDHCGGEGRLHNRGP